MKEKIAVVLGSKSDFKQLNEAFAILRPKVIEGEER